MPPVKGEVYDLVNVLYGTNYPPLFHLVEVLGGPIVFTGRYKINGNVVINQATRGMRLWTVYDAEADRTRLVNERAFPSPVPPVPPVIKDAYEGYCAKCDEISLFYDKDYVCAWCRDKLEGWRP